MLFMCYRKVTGLNLGQDSDFSNIFFYSFPQFIKDTIETTP